MKYQVWLPINASVLVKVEAENEQAAIDAAFSKVGYGPGLCHQCSNDVEFGDWREDGATAESYDEDGA